MESTAGELTGGTSVPRQQEGTPDMEAVSVSQNEARDCQQGATPSSVPTGSPSSSGPATDNAVVKTKVPAVMVAGSSPTSREMLNEQAQMLIDEVNAKRKRDTAVLGNFKKALEIQTSNAYNSVEQNVFQLYEQNGKHLQDKLQELFATLDRIAKLELELDQFKVALGALYKEMH